MGRYYKKTVVPFVFLFVFPAVILAMKWNSGLPGPGALFMTPDHRLNTQLKMGKKDPFTVFGISQIEGQIVVNPKPRKDWTWLAARNVRYGNKTFSFFFYNGLLYTAADIKTRHRRMKFQREVTPLVKSNVFMVAFYAEKKIEKELVLFIASEKKITAEVTLSPELWGEEKHITYPLQAGEGHLLSIQKMAPEYRPLFVPRDAPVRKSFLLDRNWKFHKGDTTAAYRYDFDDSKWQDVTIPHCWNARDIRDQRNVFDGYEIFTGYYRGMGWYRKRFWLDPSYRHKRIILQFEAANQIARVWVNGKKIGEHRGGYTGFEFDISELVRFDEKANIISVQVDNRYNYDIPPHSADFDMYGGIYRDVRLLIKNPISIESVTVTTPQLSSYAATVKVKTEISNKGAREKNILLTTNVVDGNGEIQATDQRRCVLKPGDTIELEQTLPVIAMPNLWSPQHPYLYEISSSLDGDGTLIDALKTPFGFRWYRFDSSEGFFLNGEHLKLRGVNKHQDYLGLGNAVPDSLLVRDMEIIKEMGANFVRLAHYPHDPAVLDACDRLGLLVWAEIPVINTIGGKQFARNARKMLREMIHRDRNHPSIILWGITNESIMQFIPKNIAKQTIQFLKELNHLARKEDPSRLTVQAHNYLYSDELAEITDVIGRNRYFGWYQGTLHDFEIEMLKEHQRHPDWKILISEYGVGSKRGYHVENAKAWDFSEEYQVKFHEYYLNIINKYSWLAGGAVWNAFDFGAATKRGNIPRINQKGLCDMARRPKDVYFFYQSQWSEKPMIYIVSHTLTKLTGGDGEKKRIRVFSNCEKVELFLNGHSLGEKFRSEGFRWHTALMPGKNILRAVGKKGYQVVEDRLILYYFIQGKNSHANQ